MTQEKLLAIGVITVVFLVFAALSWFVILPLAYTLTHWKSRLYGLEYNPTPEKRRLGNIAGLVVIAIFYVFLVYAIATGPHN